MLPPFLLYYLSEYYDLTSTAVTQPYFNSFAFIFNHNTSDKIAQSSL